jgi:hypothetical protein
MSTKTKSIRKTKKGTSAAARNTQYVIPLGNGWVVKNSLSAKFTVILDTKREAIKIARDIAKRQGSELIVHGKDGNVMQRISFPVL